MQQSLLPLRAFLNTSSSKAFWRKPPWKVTTTTATEDAPWLRPWWVSLPYIYWFILPPCFIHEKIESRGRGSDTFLRVVRARWLQTTVSIDQQMLDYHNAVLISRQMTSQFSNFWFKTNNEGCTDCPTKDRTPPASAMVSDTSRTVSFVSYGLNSHCFLSNMFGEVLVHYSL